MKSIIVLFSIILACSAQAAQFIQCTDGRGGPSNAKASLVIESIDNDNYSIAMNLTNSVVPNGLVGSFEGQYYSSQEVLVAGGKVGGVDANISLVPNETDKETFSLSVTTAGWDHRIEYGYGVHFVCKKL